MEIIECLKENEELLSKLYRIHQQRYSGYADFWGRLADDEKWHAQKIESLAQEENAKINAKRFDKKIIEDFKKTVELEIERFQSKDFGILDALKSAQKLEKSLSEKEFFKVLESDDHDTKLLFEEMKESIAKHQERIEKMLEKAK